MKFKDILEIWYTSMIKINIIRCGVQLISRHFLKKDDSWSKLTDKLKNSEIVVFGNPT